MSNAGFDNSKPGSSSIQFGTAEYVGAPGADHCQFCQQPIAGSYYRLQGATACRSCAEQAHALATDSHANYMRGLVYGIGAAIAGLILYAAFEIVTGLIIGYVSLAVGWMVGKAMMKGSSGHGGRRYQITAALLTYAAVSMAAIPIWIHYAGEHKSHASQQQQLADEQRSLDRKPDAPKHWSPPNLWLTLARLLAVNPRGSRITFPGTGRSPSRFDRLVHPLHRHSYRMAKYSRDDAESGWAISVFASAPGLS